MMSWDLEGSDRGLILRYYPGIRLERPRKTMKKSVRIAAVRAKLSQIIPYFIYVTSSSRPTIGIKFYVLCYLQCAV
jgi:hypothetical protein